MKVSCLIALQHLLLFINYYSLLLSILYTNIEHNCGHEKCKKVLQLQHFLEEPKGNNLAVFCQCLYNFHHKIYLLSFRVVRNIHWNKMILAQPGKGRKVLTNETSN